MTRLKSVLILYRLAPEASPTFLATQHALQTRPRLACRTTLLVLDNSPEAHQMPPGAIGEYRHDGSNPGLAPRYQQALQEAEAQGITWLMLLDQDTQLTDAYFDEVEALTERFADDPAIAGLIPKLTAGDRLLSPHLPCYRRSPYRLHMGVSGLLGGLLRAFNSGAVLRVSALLAIGGFPQEYWLDYLDHATFHRLQSAGGQIWVMETAIEHDLSVHRPGRYDDPAHASRHYNQLAAEALFYRQHGSQAERESHRRNLLRLALRSTLHGQFAEARRFVHAARTVLEEISR